MNISFKTFVFGTCVCGAALGVLVLPAGQADGAAAVAGNKPLPEVYTMEAAQAVMVTVEVPPVKDDREAEALLRHGYEVDVISMRFPGEEASGQHKGVRIFREIPVPDPSRKKR